MPQKFLCHLGMAKPGFACKSLQKTTLHGLSTDWSFDDGVKNVNLPDATIVKSAAKHANFVHYDYNFASDGDSTKGVISFYDDMYVSSLLQKQSKHLMTGNEMVFVLSGTSVRQYL